MTLDASPNGIPAVLSPMEFPLRGSRLIEASAGTGKTFTIAALYVRLVLGHGGGAAFDRPLMPPDILVVTFTDAATQELRDRIRSRLAEAAAAFLVDPSSATDDAAGDEFLRALRAAYPPEAWASCARKLQLAAEWMDEAAVSTIHAWCNRMLGEHAFDSNSLFDRTLETDQGELLAEAVRDYWRTFYFPLEAAEVRLLRAWWAAPEQLQEALRPLLPHAGALEDAAEPRRSIGTARDEAARQLADCKAPWPRWADELERLLDAAVDAKHVQGAKIQRRFYRPWLEALRAWAASEATVSPDLKTGWTRLTPDGLAEAWKEGAPPDHPALQALADLPARLARLPDARGDLLRHAARWVCARFAAEQERRAQMGFDDLLARLESALHGPDGEHLAAAIRAQFPVAMIDEFQDTDPLQYRIFDAIYRVAANAPDTGLILIGDPKQAIYAFRGADIHTYLRARRATAGRHHTLGTNFRSTRAMVAAVNRVFERAEQHGTGNGAFLLRGAADNPVPFFAVQARGREERLLVDGREAPALTCWVLDEGETLSKTAYVQRLAQACADEVVALLLRGAQGRAGFWAKDGDPSGAGRALHPGDIAVLVNNGKEAAQVREALAAGGVRSVYLSDKDSVFRSPQARELQRWLAACAEPEDERLLRAALATASLGMDWAGLDRLKRDEAAWEARVLQFRAYRQCWRSQGVLPMLRRLLADFAVPRRLLAGGGERALTDLLHLAELLQQASALLDGEHALIRHLAEQQRQDSDGADARKLRLEDDAALVKVVTVHKSKGLEYPLVFLPFACAFRATRPDDAPLKWHDADGRLQVALTADAQAVAQADRERLGEDLRKFYVALTRARHATWIGMAPLKALEHSAPGYLLAGGQQVAAGGLAEHLQAWCGAAQDIAVAALPEAAGRSYRHPGEAEPLGPERRLRRIRPEPWWVASYSGLRVAAAAGIGDGGAASPPPAAETAAEDIYAESQDGPAAEPSGVPAGGMHAFPRGPHPGSFLHGLLEWAAAEGFGEVAARPEKARDLIARRSSPRGWSRWIPTLSGWLPSLMDTAFALPGGGTVRLAALAPGDYQVEMEFWFSIRQVDTLRLDRLVREATLAGVPRPALAAGQLNGMLKGFIDLVFEHDGRYYVADYKSNWLGPDDGAYSAEAMRDAVLAHRYDLQCALYLFALHRLLRARLPDYDYDRHVGGALCLFLRGTEASTQGLHPERPPRALMDALDALFAGASLPEGEA